MARFYQIALSLFVIGVSLYAPLQADKPDLLLLKPHNASQPVAGWLMSEKLDGIRAYWDGKQLWTRGGKRIQAPDWFTQALPSFALDGELWTQRNDFAGVSRIVLGQEPSEAWYRVSYQIFEVPQQPGGLLARLAVLEAYLSLKNVPHLNVIAQKVCRNQADLEAYLQAVLAQQGEGVVLRYPDALYHTGRSAHALKVKQFQDDECTVTGYKPGKGKYRDQVGALWCDWSDLQGNVRTIALGSGLSDALRQSPPLLGAKVTFKYYGLTASGLPRHAVFLRERSVE